MRHLLPALALTLLLATPARGFDGDRAFELLEAQVDFGPRAPGTEAHAKQLAWMRKFLEPLADRVTPHTFQFADPYSDQTLQLTNLKASFRPELGTPVTLMAHWDCRPRADREPGGPVDQPIPGANDGASGVAVLLALAEMFAETPPPVQVDLLFVDGEDWGQEGDHTHYSVGAKRFVADHPQYAPRAVILIDMVGDADLRIPMEQYSHYAAAGLVQSVFQRALQLGLTAFEPSVGPAVMDDHIPFLQAGIPAVDLIDFDYPYWHTLADTPDKCSPASLDQVGTLLASLVYQGFP